MPARRDSLDTSTTHSFPSASAAMIMSISWLAGSWSIVTILVAFALAASASASWPGSSRSSSFMRSREASFALRVNQIDEVLPILLIHSPQL